jgi:hypothetical protein
VTEQQVPNRLWIIGDLHADILSLENAWQFILSDAKRENVEPSALFLGDFIDRGQYNHETLVRLFRIIRKHPGRIGVLAGNHDEALRFDEPSDRFVSDIEPAEYKEELNEWKVKAEGGHGEARDRLAVGKAAVDFFRRCPRAILLPDGTLFAHAGFPHTDLHESLKSWNDLQTPDCLKDFAWLRASRSAPRKLPNRLSRGCEFGAKDFADFCKILKQNMEVTVKRLVRGHDHIPDRAALWPRYSDYPVVTINTMGRRLVDEYNTDPYPQACIALHRPEELPIVYRLPIHSSEVAEAEAYPSWGARA